MSVPENGSPTTSASAREAAPEGQSAIMLYRNLLLRRWAVIAGAGLVGLLASAWLMWRATPIYSAEVTVRRQEQPAALVGLTPVMPDASEEARSEIEIMRTNSFLEPVVDSTGLRLRLLAEPDRRSRIFREIRIGPEAPPGEFVLTLVDGALNLTTAQGTVVTTVRETDILTGDGFFLTVDREQLQPGEDVRFVIDDRREVADQLARRLEVDPMEGTDLMRIAYRSSDPLLASGVPNAVSVLYQRYAADRAKLEATRRRKFIETQLENVADSLTRAQAQLLAYQASAQTVNPQEEGQALSQLLITEQQKLRDLTEDQNTLENLLASFRSQGRGDEALRQMVVLSGQFFPAAEALYGRLQELESDRSRLTASPLIGRTSSDPQVQMVDSLINVTKAEMRAIAGQSLQLLRERRGVADRRVQELEQQVGAVPERNTTFGRLQQRVEAIQRQHDALAEKFYEAQITEAVEAGNVEIVESARMPVQPLPPQRARNVFLGLLAGLIIGFGVASLQEQLDTRVKDGPSAAKASSLELIATIPMLSGLNGNGSRLAAEPRDVENFRMLRTNLRFVRANRPRTIMITSAAPGEGKSLIAANLATSYANEGSRVLLIDVDMRRPVQHTLFSVPRAPGLSELLTRQTGSDAVARVLDGSLYFLPAGTAVPNPPELLGSPIFGKFLERALEVYDIVILDSPPVLAVTDTSLLAPVVDGVVLVSRFDQTDRRALTQAATQLRRTGAALLGLVMNGIPGGRLASYYDYYGYQQNYDVYFKDAKPTSRSRAAKSAPKVRKG